MTSEHDTVEILLVEDNPGDVRLTQEALKDGRIANNLQVVNDGAEALDYLFQRGEHADASRPDLVLLDLNLPRRSGKEVLQELHGDDNTRQIPVIVLTSSKSEQDVVSSYDLCASGFLTKPVDPGEFIEMIRSIEQYWLSIVRLPNRS